MNTLEINVAYKFVVMMMMLIEVNLASERLNLPMERPVTVADIRGDSTVSPPRLLGVTGSIVTEDNFFGFKDGILRSIATMSELKLADLRRKIEAHPVSPLTHAEAKQLALKWLESLGYDLAKLPDPLRIEEGFFAGTEDMPVRPSLINVKWGKRQFPEKARTKLAKSRLKDYIFPVLEVRIVNPTRELLHIRFDGELEIVGRPPIRILKLDDLLAIKDETFAAMTWEERKQLFEKHTGVRFPANLLPKQNQEDSNKNCK